MGNNHNNSSKYQTEAKLHIFKICQQFSSDFTAKDVMARLDHDHSISTVYRILDSLIDEGRLIKNGSSYLNVKYHNCNNQHFFLKCNSCQKTIHVDCDELDDLKSHIYNNHGLLANLDNLVLSGTCRKCLNRDQGAQS